MIRALRFIDDYDNYYRRIIDGCKAHKRTDILRGGIGVRLGINLLGSAGLAGGAIAVELGLARRAMQRHAFEHAA